MNKASLNIIFFYTIGLLILAMGLTLNTKANLGVSPIISIPYCFSQIFHLNFGNATLVLYCIFVVIEILLHLLAESAHPLSGKITNVSSLSWICFRFL